jgi:hypothetical protein
MATDLTLPVDADRVAELVAREFAGHAQHVRDAAAAEFRARAARLRSAPTDQDPVTEALTASCHTQAGLIYAQPAVVAAVALEAAAALLTNPDTPLEDSHGEA